MNLEDREAMAKLFENEKFDYKPSMSVKQGVENFAVWYKEYNKL